MNRRIKTSALRPGYSGSHFAYWGEWHRYRQGKKIYSIPFGVVWVAR